MANMREKLRIIIFESDTTAGKYFDIGLLIAIVASIVCVSLETLPAVKIELGQTLRRVEWVFTGLFTLEYLLRVATTHRPLKYCFSFFGLVDLLSILPTYAGLYFSGAQSFLVIRSIRIIRVFRVLKLVRFIKEATILAAALRASQHKIIVFIVTISCSVVIIGAFIYTIEGPENGFTSIPKSIYWAIVTMTTVGYGDIAPKTVIGQTFAAMVMILGYGIIAVPTGIVSYEISQAVRNQVSAHGGASEPQKCPKCGSDVP